MELWSREDVTADLVVAENRRSYAGHTIYRVVLKVFTAGDVPVKLNEVFVWRRYSELKRLHKDLKNISLQSEEASASFPEFIKAKIFGRFEEHIIEERQRSARQFLKFVAERPNLFKSGVLKRFFEGAVKCNQQNALTEPSDEPLYLNEINNRLSLSGSITDESREIDSAEEELEPMSTNQSRGVWNNRQPTPDPLENNTSSDQEPRIEVFTASDETTSVDVTPGDHVTANGVASGKENSAPVEDETLAESQQISTAHVQNNQKTSDAGVSEIDTMRQDFDAALHSGKEISDPADDVVFDGNDVDNEEAGKWLREAFSVCSEGDDIEQLASEADDSQDIASLSVSQLREDSNEEEANSAKIPKKLEDDGTGEDEEDDLIEALCSLPKLPDDVVDDDTDQYKSEDLPECAVAGSIPKQIHDDALEEDTNDCHGPDFGFSRENSSCPRSKEADCRNGLPEGADADAIGRDEEEKVREIGENVKDMTVSGDERETLPTDDISGRLLAGRDERAQNSDLKTLPHRDDSTKNRFSLSLDDKMKARIQKAIETDDYVYQASLAMSEAIEREEQKQYQSSFELYKLGIGLLLQGVQQDSDEERRVAVRRKTAQYLLRAENVYKNYLHESKKAKDSRKSAMNLAEVRTIGVIDKIFLVERYVTGDIFAVKVLHKCGAEYKNKREFVSKGNRKLIDSKYMVKLRHYTETSTGIYLFLEFISGGLLWNYLDMDLRWNTASSNCDVNANMNRSDATTSCAGQLKNAEAKSLENENHGVTEDMIRVWMAEIVSVLSDLHEHGIICKDLNPRNILLDSDGHIKLTYFSNIRGVEYCIYENDLKRSYAAPEANGIFPLTQAADWWSLGAIFFELLTRKSLHSCYPAGIHSHSIINLPKPVSNEAWSLLAGLIRYNSKDRLGSGVAGCEEIMSHPFFASINWKEI